jgi:hypothetical protein
MDCRDILIDGLGRVDESVVAILAGLTVDQLTWRPGPQANPIGWLAWHLARVADAQVADVAGLPQAWIEAGWHARFERPADAHDNGYGHTSAQVAAFQPISSELLRSYYADVHERSLRYLATVECEDLDRVVDTRWDPPVTAGVRLVSIVNDLTQHVGQMAYVRGLLVS